jgi:hypothetical protein
MQLWLWRGRDRYFSPLLQECRRVFDRPFQARDIALRLCLRATSKHQICRAIPTLAFSETLTGQRQCKFEFSSILFETASTATGRTCHATFSEKRHTSGYRDGVTVMRERLLSSLPCCRNWVRQSRTQSSSACAVLPARWQLASRTRQSRQRLCR